MPQDELAGSVVSPPSPKSDAGRVSVAPLIIAGITLAVAIAIALLALTGGAGTVIAGLSDPGVVTRYGVTVARVVAEGASVVCIGSLLLAAFFVSPQTSGVLSADGYAALRRAAFSAWIWCGGAVASALFTAADAVGRPVAELFSPTALVSAIDAVEQPKAWLLTSATALLLAVGCRVVLSWRWTTVLFFVSLAGILPIAMSGHSASGGSHDVATNSLLFHLIAAVLWVGGLVALLGLGFRRGSPVVLAAQRFSRLALACWVIMAVSGVVNALVRVQLDDLLTTDYGLLLIAKLVALIVLGIFGHQQRQHALRSLREGKRRQLLRLGVVEVLIMFVTFGLANALSRTAPPQSGAVQPSTTELLIGYDLAGPPTVARLLFDWRFDLVYGTAAIALAALYVAAVLRLRRRGDAWPVGRMVAWLAGCATLLIATSSGIGRYSPAMFSVHMSSHMLLSMIIPVLLVLGGPVTVALRALPVGAKDAPGPREWVLAAVHSRVAKALTHPVVALTIFVGSFYLLYFSGIFDQALNYHWAHLAMNAHFLLAGYIFYWPIIGVDPAPRRIPSLGKLGLLFAAMPFHAFFGVIVMNRQTVIGEPFYRALNLPWVDNLLLDQRLGGGIGWAAGEIPVLLVLIALLVQWARADEREARRVDRREDNNDGADLAAYNAMLKRLSESGDKPEK